MKILNSKTHGLIDYLFVVLLWASPTLFHLPEQTSLFTYVLGSIHLLVTVTTDFKFGLIKLLPFKLHGWIELVVSFALIGVAFYLETIEGSLSRNFYFGIAVLVFITWLITDYSSSENS